MKTGRKRKAGARYPSGKRTRVERERDAMATALEARQRHYGVTQKQAKDERLGSALGRLAFKQLISNGQYQAGIEFAKLHHRFTTMFGLPQPNPQSVSNLLINEGVFGSSPSEVAIDAIERLRKRYDVVKSALDTCDREQTHAIGRQPSRLIYEVICLDCDIDEKHAADIGSLRIGLNALSRVFKLHS
jgi:hypothetical protein